MVKRVLVILSILCAVAMAQQYYEASGRTQVFTLAAGAKAGPSAMAPESRRMHFIAPGIRITANNGVILHVQGITSKALVHVYNVAGKRVLRIDVDGGTSVTVSKLLQSGVYFARLEVNGRATQTIRFRMVR
jgi:hypothetical protein